MRQLLVALLMSVLTGAAVAQDEKDVVKVGGLSISRTSLKMSSDGSKITTVTGRKATFLTIQQMGVAAAYATAESCYLAQAEDAKARAAEAKVEVARLTGGEMPATADFSQIVTLKAIDGMVATTREMAKSISVLAKGHYDPCGSIQIPPSDTERRMVASNNRHATIRALIPFGATVLVAREHRKTVAAASKNSGDRIANVVVNGDPQTQSPGSAGQSNGGGGSENGTSTASSAPGFAQTAGTSEQTVVVNQGDNAVLGVQRDGTLRWFSQDLAASANGTTIGPNSSKATPNNIDEQNAPIEQPDNDTGFSLLRTRCENRGSVFVDGQCQPDR